MACIGIIQVPLSAFFFDKVTRGEDRKAIRRLGRVFDRTGCKPNDEKNFAKGLVDPDILQRICSALGISEDRFRQEIGVKPPPRIALPRCISCFDGKQRIAAAKIRYGMSYWWTVKLYLLPQSNNDPGEC